MKSALIVSSIPFHQVSALIFNYQRTINTAKGPCLVCVFNANCSLGGCEYVCLAKYNANLLVVVPFFNQDTHATVVSKDHCYDTMNKHTAMSAVYTVSDLCPCKRSGPVLHVTPTTTLPCGPEFLWGRI